MQYPRVGSQVAGEKKLAVVIVLQSLLKVTQMILSCATQEEKHCFFLEIKFERKKKDIFFWLLERRVFEAFLVKGFARNPQLFL